MCYTPKSASWLNRVEIELSVLSRQVSELERQVDAWAEARNRKQVRVNCQFTPITHNTNSNDFIITQKHNLPD